MAFSGSQITRLGLSGITRPIPGSFLAKAAATGADLIAQAKSLNRFVFARIFGRVN